MVVQSFGALQSFTDRGRGGAAIGTSGGSVNLYGRAVAYATIYATQPNVRTCVDFLARNTAELALQAFRRKSDTDRERLHGHDLERWLERPNPARSRYRLFEDLVSDLGIFFNAAWLKIPWQAPDEDRERVGLVRLPPDEWTVDGGLLPTKLVWTRDGRQKDFDLTDVVRFDGYNPLNSLMGLSPLETLRRTLAEEQAAGEHREQFWRNASRHEGVVERPLAAPRWQPHQKKEWREQWQERFAGAAGAGLVAVLEDGMTFKATSFSPRESEYTSARKLTREECAAAYHIPLPLVGILEHATFSNIKEQHKHLYQDCLGPWLRMIKEEIQRQLLIECDDTADVYTEFNIAQKLAGSFEEQSASLSTAIGRPYMTGNEGRARVNLPAITDDPTMDQVAKQQGGPSTGSSAGGDNPDDSPDAARARELDNQDDGGLDARTPGAIAWSRTVAAFWSRQQQRVEKDGAADRASKFDRARWNRELAADLAQLTTEAEARTIAEAINQDTFALLEAQQPAFSADRDDHWPGERTPPAAAEAAVLTARVEALERRAEHRPAYRREFVRDQANGLVTAFVDRPIEAEA
jgi:HK97 family phage portal protein